MRLDKFTTRFQEALSDAQSLALGNDNQYIEPQHLLRALLAQNDGAARALLARAGVNVNGLQTALDAASRGRTTIAVAHRLSTIVAADVIFVVVAGRVVERGTHSELLAARGMYASLYEQQVQGT